MDSFFIGTLLLTFLVLSCSSASEEENREVISKECYPYGSIAILIDYSDSVEDQETQKREFVKTFSNWANPQMGATKLDISVMGFASSARLEAFTLVDRNNVSATDVQMTYNRELEKAKRKGELGGSTHMHTGLQLVWSKLKASPKKKVIVALSDGVMSGMNEIGRRTEKAYKKLAQRYRDNDWLIFSIYLHNDQRAIVGQDFMRSIAYNATYFKRLTRFDPTQNDTLEVLRTLYDTVCIFTYSAKREALEKLPERKRQQEVKLFAIFGALLAMLLVAAVCFACVAVRARKRNKGAAGNVSAYSEAVSGMTSITQHGAGSQGQTKAAGIGQSFGADTNQGNVDTRAASNKGFGASVQPSILRKGGQAGWMGAERGQNVDLGVSIDHRGHEEGERARSRGQRVTQTFREFFHRGQGHKQKTNASRAQQVTGLPDTTKGKAGSHGAHDVTKGQQVTGGISPSFKGQTAEAVHEDMPGGQQVTRIGISTKDQTGGNLATYVTKGQQVTRIGVSTKDQTGGNLAADVTKGQQVTRLGVSTKDQTGGHLATDVTKGQQVTRLGVSTNDQTGGHLATDVTKGQQVTQAFPTANIQHEEARNLNRDRGQNVTKAFTTTATKRK